LGITLHLSWVGLAKADDTNPVGSFCEAQNVDTVSHKTQSYVPSLRVLPAIVHGEHSGVEAEVCGSLEAKTSQPQVAFVLGLVEGDPHRADCMHKQMAALNWAEA
jgi:hypothetical protein